MEGNRVVRVVIADDIEELRALTRLMLETSSQIAVIGEARDGQEAVDMAATLDPDVMLLDLSMPRLDGLEAMRIIHARHGQIKLVAFSSLGADLAEKEARLCGASLYLEKALIERAKLITAILEVGRVDVAAPVAAA